MDELSLFHTLADAPDDEGARAVFGDWLLERGDPMSEFIALQAAQRKKPLDQLRAQRAQDLLIMHWKRWMGPLHRALHRRACVFQGGFLHEADVSLPVASHALGLRDAPQWATVRRLEIVGVADSVARVLESPWLRNLRHLRCRADALVRTSSSAFTLDTLELSGSESARLERRPAWDQLSSLVLRDFDAPLSALALIPRALLVHAKGLDQAVKLVRVALDRSAPVTVVTSAWHFAVTPGSTRVVAQVTTFSKVDTRVLRQLGEVELEVVFGERIYRGPARSFDW